MEETTYAPNAQDLLMRGLSGPLSTHTAERKNPVPDDVRAPDASASSERCGPDEPRTDRAAGDQSDAGGLPWDLMDAMRLEADEARHDAQIVRRALVSAGIGVPGADASRTEIEIFRDAGDTADGDESDTTIKRFLPCEDGPDGRARWREERRANDPGDPRRWRWESVGDAADADRLADLLVEEARSLRSILILNEDPDRGDGDADPETLLDRDDFWLAPRVRGLLDPASGSVPFDGERCVEELALCDLALARLRSVRDDDSAVSSAGRGADDEPLRWLAGIEAHAALLRRVYRNRVFYFGEVVPYESRRLAASRPPLFLDF